MLHLVNGDPTSTAAPLPTSVGVYLLLVRAARNTLAAVALLLGAVLIFGGHQRFGSPSLAVARQVPGEAYTWGALAAAAGIVVVAGRVLRRWTLVEIGMFALGGWSWFFALSVLATAVRDPRASLTGAVTYAGLAVLATSHGVALRYSRRPRRRGPLGRHAA